MATDPLNISPLLNNYAQFRINCVVVRFYPVFTDAQYGASGPQPYMPMLGWARDFDDANPLASLNAIQERRDYKETLFNRPIKIKVYPAVAPEIYASAASTAYGVKRKQWIRSVNSDAKHYGLKWVLYQVQATQVLYINTRTTYYMSFAGAI